MVAAARRFVVVAETPKKVERLGEGFRLPVEVVRFALAGHAPAAGGAAARRRAARDGDDEPYVTDEGHYILDCALPPGADPDELAPALKRVPGVVEHGLFLGMAERALLGHARRRRRRARGRLAASPLGRRSLRARPPPPPAARARAVAGRAGSRRTSRAKFCAAVR